MPPPGGSCKARRPFCWWWPFWSFESILLCSSGNVGRRCYACIWDRLRPRLHRTIGKAPYWTCIVGRDCCTCRVHIRWPNEKWLFPRVGQSEKVCIFRTLVRPCCACSCKSSPPSDPQCIRRRGRCICTARRWLNPRPRPTEVLLCPLRWEWWWFHHFHLEIILIFSALANEIRRETSSNRILELRT